MATSSKIKIGKSFPLSSKEIGLVGNLNSICIEYMFGEVAFGWTNYGKPHQFDQKKGLWEGPVSIDGDVIKDWEIIPLEFKGDWVRR